jgi:hypothetical protein
MITLELIKYAAWCGFFIIASFTLTRFMFGSIRGVANSLGNTFSDHIRCTIYHETQTMFPYETMTDALRELQDIYLSRIRTSKNAVDIGFWIYCYSVLKSMREEHEDEVDYGDTPQFTVHTVIKH